MVVDPTADAAEAKRLYGITFASMDDVKNMDAIIIAVAHEDFMKLTKIDIKGFYNPNNLGKVLADIKGILDRKEYEKDFSYWRL